MAGKDRLEFDVLANDKASTTLDKIARGAKAIGAGLDKAESKGSGALEKLTKKAKEAGKSVGELGSKAGSGLKNLSGSLMKAGPLALIGLGVGLGGMLMQGFNEAMAKEDATHLLAAQIGASNAEMGKLGKISGDLYKNAFGESVADVSQTMRTVFQSGLASVKDSEDAIKGVTTQVMNYSKIAGEEALPVTRAVSQMLKTGLARNATEAFDLLTRGIQKGLNKSEDLLDTVNEYGTQFRKLGLTGTQAFGLISQAIQAGARDSDIAADALKEFSIRAIDGSTLTAQSFKALGLSAKQMSEDIVQGGPKATVALDTVLDRLRGVKDPVKQAQIAVGLFGTQAEDLGKALYAMNLDTATQQFGQVAGAAERAGDLINDTTSNKLTTMGRTIKMAIVDAISKYALPHLAKFADWFNGPGKMAMVGWALEGSQAIVNFADKSLGALGSMIPALVKFGSTTFYAAAALAAVSGNQKQATEFFIRGKTMEIWGDATAKSIGKARTEMQGWNASLEKAKTKVMLTADIEDLDQKLAKAQAELRDPGLTKTRRAEIQANIAQLNRAKDDAIRKLGDPNLIKTRTAKLDADKRALDAKIQQARNELEDPKLTRERRATLNANIAQLLRQKANAQAAINSLTGKTVVISVAARINAAQIRNKVDQQLARYGLDSYRAAGGPVKKGQSYVVGEKRPELFVPEQDGMIVPSVPPTSSPKAYGSMGVGGSGGWVTLNFDDSETGRFMLRMMRKAIANSGNFGNVQLALGGRPV